MTPKSRTSETRSRTDPPMEYGCTTGDVFRLSVKAKHFDAFRRSFQSADHLLRLSRSDCSCSQSDVGDGLIGVSGREVAHCVQKFIFSSHRFR